MSVSVHSKSVSVCSGPFRSVPVRLGPFRSVPVNRDTVLENKSVLEIETSRCFMKFLFQSFRGRFNFQLIKSEFQSIS